MKQTITTVLLLILTASAYAQLPNWNWAKGIGSSQDDNAMGTVVDAIGNIYTIGSFQGTNVSFGGILLSSNGDKDIFITKQSSSGTFIWAKNIGGNLTDEGLSISIDLNGNIFILCKFASSSFQFDGFSVNNQNIGTIDILIAKINGNGIIQWVNTAGGNHNEYPRTISTDNSGNIIITGFFESSSIVFGLTTLNNSGYRDIFVAKYDNNGAILWAKSFGGSWWDLANQTSFDKYNNLYLVGGFGSPTISFGSTTLIKDITSNTFDLFITKLDSNGNAIWAKGAGGNSSEEFYRVVTDNNGNSYAVGYFQSPSIIIGNNSFSNTGVFDMILAKYDSNGKNIWSKKVGGTGSDLPQGIALDTISSKLYFSGHYKSPTLTFGIKTINNAGNNDIFISVTDTAGNFIDAISIGGSGDDQNTDLSYSQKSGIVITGFYSSSAMTVGNTTVTNSGLYDILIARLANSCTPTTSSTNTSICPSQLPYSWNAKTLTGAGTLIDTLTNAGGCDSIATLNLTVKATRHQQLI